MGVKTMQPIRSGLPVIALGKASSSHPPWPRAAARSSDAPIQTHTATPVTGVTNVRPIGTATRTARIAQLGPEQQAMSARPRAPEATRSEPIPASRAMPVAMSGKATRAAAEVPPADALQSDRQGDREQAGGDAAGGADRPDLTATADDAGDDAPG
jgi:hypothetical protein